jgi:hypothetical protein
VVVVTALIAIAASAVTAAVMPVGSFGVGVSEDMFNDLGVRQCLVRAVDHAQEQVGADVVDRAPVPSPLARAGQSVDVVRRGGDSVDRLLIAAKVRGAVWVS